MNKNEVKPLKIFLLFSVIDNKSLGLMNLSQSWVPLATKFNTYSAAIIPRAHERKFLLSVVMNNDPPG